MEYDRLFVCEYISQPRYLNSQYRAYGHNIYTLLLVTIFIHIRLG